MSFVPLFAGAGWFAQSVGAIVVVVGLGIVVRHWLPRVPAFPVQLAGLSFYVTALFARSEAVLGFVPGKAALAELVAIGRDGLIAAVVEQPPVPHQSAIVALTVVGVGLIALLVDLFAVGLRRPAIAGVPLLVLYIVPVSIVAETNPFLFLPAGIGYVGLLLAEGRHRIIHLGQRLDPDPADGADDRAEPPGRPPRRMLRTARNTGAAALAGAVVVPALLPGALADGLLDPRDLQQLDSWNAGPRTTVTTVDPMVSLHRDLNRPSNIPLMRVRPSDTGARDQYLRLAALDQFDGEQWTASNRDPDDLPTRLPPPEGLANSTPRTEVQTSIRILDSYRSAWLPLPQPATHLDLPGDWAFDRQSRTITGAGTQTTENLDYSVRSLAIDPSAERLRDAPEPPDDLADHHTELPDDLPPIVERLARQVTRDATSPYDRAIALQEWFLDPQQFRYDTTVTSDQSASALAEFLHDRVGYCQQFAATMAVMARLLDIPARVAVGFTPGTLQPDGSYLIGVHDAHAWPELYFPETGWVRFEPTPTISGDRAETPAWATPEPSPTPSTDDPTTSRSAERSSPTTTSTEQATPEQSREETPAPAPVADGGSAGPRIPLRPFGIAALVALVASTPMLLRSLIRRHRLRRLDPVRRTAGAWAELRATARDLGYAWPRELTVRQRAGRLRAEAALDRPAADALDRIARAVEMASFGPTLRLAGDPAADARLVRRGLAVRAGRLTRWRSRLLPTSLFTYAAELTRRFVRRIERYARPARIVEVVRTRTAR